MSWLPATRYDLSRLCDDMRESDLEEALFCAMATRRWHEGWLLEDELFDAFDASPHWSLWDGDDFVAMAGVAPVAVAPGLGAIWMLGTDLMDARWRAVIPACRSFIAAEAPHWLRMGNVIPAHMTGRRRWLEHLGFDFPESEALRANHRLVAFWSQADPGPESGLAAP